ncbi:hypothetical protein J7L68_09495, partial [bacterium]|nr:hypothetical protein [bacterium]
MKKKSPLKRAEGLKRAEWLTPSGVFFVQLSLFSEQFPVAPAQSKFLGDNEFHSCEKKVAPKK